MGRKKITDQRRKQIVEALYLCLSETGYERVNVKQIAARAGLTHGAIHYYFANKEEIVDELIASLVEKYQDDFQELLRTHTDRNELIPIVIDYFMESFVFDRRLSRVFVNLVEMSFEREKVRSQMKKMYNAYRKNFKRFAELAGIEEKNVNALAIAVTSLMVGLSSQRAIDPKSVDRESVQELVAYLGGAVGLFGSRNA